MRWCNFKQSTSNHIQIHEKLHNFNKMNLVNALSGNMPRLRIVSRWFAFETASKTSYNLWFCKQLKFKTFLGCLGTGISFHSQRIAYLYNINNSFPCLGQSEVLVYIDNYDPSHVYFDGKRLLLSWNLKQMSLVDTFVVKKPAVSSTDKTKSHHLPNFNCEK